MTTLAGYSEQQLTELGGQCTAREILQQPQLWRQTYELVMQEREKVHAILPKVRRIILAGAGSSHFTGAMIAPYLTRHLGRPVEAVSTTDLVTNPLNYMLPAEPTLLISYGRSGNSPESVAAVKLAQQLMPSLYQVVLTCNPTGELAEISRKCADTVLMLMPEDSNDDGFAMTGSVTCMILASLLLLSEQTIEMINHLADSGQHVLSSYVDVVHSLAQEEFDRIVYLGSSCLRFLAEESCLKMLELSAGRVVTLANSALGFRHGPKSIVNANTVVVFFLSGDPYTRQYELDLLREMSLERKAKKLVCISWEDDAGARELADLFIAVGQPGQRAPEDVLSLFSYLLLAQLLALFKSLDLGIAPDNPSPEGTVNRVVKGVTIYPLV